MPNIKTNINNMVISALLAAILIVAQVALAFLPNIELVSVLIICYTLSFPKRIVLPSIFVFCLVQGLIYGFSIWWVTYLYVWPVLVAIVLTFRQNTSILFWAIIAALYGLGYGGLCAVLYLFIGNIQTAISFWVTGIPFDILHCIGNFFTVLILFKPICYILKLAQTNTSY